MRQQWQLFLGRIDLRLHNGTHGYGDVGNGRDFYHLYCNRDTRCDERNDHVSGRHNYSRSLLK